jgi:hypothetical protein
VVRIDEDGNRTEVKVSKVRAHSHWKACIFCDSTNRSSWISRIGKIETSDMFCSNFVLKLLCVVLP